MVFYDEAEARKLYERYKLQWMVYHGLGLVDLMHFPLIPLSAGLWRWACAKRF